MKVIKSNLDTVTFIHALVGEVRVIVRGACGQNYAEMVSIEEARELAKALLECADKAEGMKEMPQYRPSTLLPPNVVMSYGAVQPISNSINISGHPGIMCGGAQNDSVRP